MLMKTKRSLRKKLRRKTIPLSQRWESFKRNLSFYRESFLQSLCQECLEKHQSAYEFKFRCEENRNFLRNYLKESADSKLAEARAAKEAALEVLHIDIDNLDNLPDKLVLKQIKKEKKPRKPRDPSKPAVIRRLRIPEKNIIIAEDSQVESAAYVRKVIVTPEQSPDQKRVNKRKSKHVVIEDILVAERGGRKENKPSKSSKDANANDSKTDDSQTEKESKPKRNDDEPVFEDDDDFEEEPEVKRPKRSKK